MNSTPLGAAALEDQLYIAEEKFNSRLLVGTGRYRNASSLISALEASGAEVITLTLRRLPYRRDSPELQEAMELAYSLDFGRYRVVVNTSGARNAEEALYIAKEARATLGTRWIKLEVVPDLPHSKYLLPDASETRKAAEQLVRGGFVVLPYIQADPVLARQLQETGCSAVMPMGSFIGSGRGLQTEDFLRVIIEESKVPVIVDSGLREPADAAKVMRMGADAVLVSTAIHQAGDPALMAQAFRKGVEAGRMAYCAGLMEQNDHARPSCPVDVEWGDLHL